MRVLLSLILLSLQAYAEVTIYTQVTFGAGNATSATSTYTAPAAYDTTVLTAPPVPSPPIATQFPVQLYSGGMQGLSIPQSGSFVGFSVELSVSDQICKFTLGFHCFGSYFVPSSWKEWVRMAAL